MEIRNAIYKTVPVRNLTFPLAAGTVVTAGGTLANSDGSDAYGIVPETVALLPLTKRLYVAVAGTIDLATCGATFTDTMIKALGEDFNFVPAKEEHEPPAPELPTVSSTDNGKILMVVNGQWAAADLPSELPTVESTDAGKVLTVVTSGDDTFWAAAEIPSDNDNTPSPQ